MYASRRRFLVQSAHLGAAALASTWPARRTPANPLGRPIGIQLYTVNAPLQENARRTLETLRDIGFGEVESAGFAGRSAKEFRRLLDDAGLACPSAHLSFDLDNLGAAFEDAHALGASYAASGSLPAPAGSARSAAASAKRSMSLDEAKRTAELANRIGDAAKRAGLQYVYHNHDFEFVDQGGGAIGYDVLLRETDPRLVQFEIDCGWMIFAGHDPVEYFKKYPHRFAMIHVKDFLPPGRGNAAPGGAADMQGAELGRGSIDYKPIFAAAGKAGLRHYFVEQEGPFARMDQLQAARVDYDYLHAMS
jgi:sugar phosphate isomerase/epimerase